MTKRDAQMGVEAGLAPGGEIFLMTLADAGQAGVLVMHFFQTLLGAAMRIDAGAHGFHVRQTGF